MPPGETIASLSSRISSISKEYGIGVDPGARVYNLSVGQQQRVEIIRCLLQDPKLLIMDEPTSVLTPGEVSDLFVVLKKLAGQGMSILYISHKLEEIRMLCSKATIMRNGKVVNTCDPRKLSAGKIAESMVGASFSKPKKSKIKIGRVLLELQNVFLESKTAFGVPIRGINLKLHEGQIVGIGGVAGNGQSELMDILVGENNKIDSGEIIFKNTNIETFNPQQRRNLSIAFVPENRLGHSAVPELTLSENILLSQFANNKFSKYGIIDNNIIEKHTNTEVSPRRSGSQCYKK